MSDKFSMSDKWKSMADLTPELEERERAVLAGEIRWGPWSYDKETAFLIWEQDGGDRYEVDLRRCVDAGSTLDWIAQVASKSTATAEVLGNLVLALDELFHLQATTCGSGGNRRFDPLEVLGRKVG